MSSALLILLARVIHIAGGVIWVGAMFTMSRAVLPIASKHGSEGGTRWMGMVIRKLGPSSGIAGLLSIISGIYLMFVLHPHDTSPGGIVLMVGAAAALLAFIVGFFIGRPAGMKLAMLSEQAASQGTPSAEAAQQLAPLQTKATSSAKITLILLIVAVLAMAIFRYVQAI
jgi:uncharacterized membrane protein